MLYKTLSPVAFGIDVTIVELEVDVSGIKTLEDHFPTVGLPDAALRESRDRGSRCLKQVRLRHLQTVVGGVSCDIGVARGVVQKRIVAAGNVVAARAVGD